MPINKLNPNKKVAEEDIERKIHQRFFTPIHYKLTHKKNGTAETIDQLTDVSQKAHLKDLKSPDNYFIRAVFADGREDHIPPDLYSHQIKLNEAETRAYNHLRNKKFDKTEDLSTLSVEPANRETQRVVEAVKTDTDQSISAIEDGFENSVPVDGGDNNENRETAVTFAPPVFVEWLDENEIAKNLQIRYGMLAPKLVNILMPIRRQIQKGHYSRRFYFFGIILFLIALIFALLSAFFGEKIFPFVVISALSCFLVFLTGTSIEIMRVALWIWNNSLGRISLGVLGLIVSQISVIFAKHWINDLTGLEPSQFNGAIWLFSTIMTVYLWSLIIISLSFIVFIVLITSVQLLGVFGNLIPPFREIFTESETCRFIFKSKPGTNPKWLKLDWINYFGRVTGILMFLFFFGSPITYFWSARHFFDQALINAFVQIEFYENENCGELEKGERIFYAGDDKIISARLLPDGSYSYRKTQCTQVEK